MFVPYFRVFKRVISFFAFTATAAAVTSLTGADCVWSGNGADNKWSTAANWQGGAAPVSGDTVTIDIGETTSVIDNDITDLTLSKFTAVGTNNIVLTITGEPIAIACGNYVNTIVWTNSCSLQLDAGMTITAGKGTVYFGGYSTIVNGDISVASGSELKFRGRTRSAKSLPGLINDDPIIKFYGDVGGEGCCLYINFGANGNGTSPYFYGNVNCAKLILNSDTRPCAPHFCKAGNRIGAITFYGCKSYFDVDNVFTPATVICPTNNAGYIWPESGLRFRTGSYQIFNRLEGSPVHLNGMCYQNIFSSESSSYAEPSTEFCTFDLRGTQDAVAYVCLCDTINVIWNPTGDFTQDFRDRRHVTSGKISVMRGTLRSSGTNSFINVGRVSVAAGATLEIASTNVVTFPSLTLMSMESGARLRIAESASEAFASKTTILTMAEDAKIQVTAGATVRLGRLLVGGKEIDEGTYTSADWMEGSGSVTVEGEINNANQTKHYWAAAIDGKWSSATNWMSGTVPGTTHSAIFDLDGADYTATFDAASDTMPASVTLSGDGNTGTLAVTNELELKAQSITVYDGGRL